MVQENRLDADNLITDSCMGTMRTMICVAALVSAGRLAALAQGGSDADAVSKILALKSAWNQAVETRDTKTLNAIFDNFLVYVEHDGPCDEQGGVSGHREKESAETRSTSRRKA